MATQTWEITGAKNNWKYRRGKNWEKKRRIKDGDILNLQHYCSPEGITVEYDKTTNNIKFSKPALEHHDPIKFDGLNSGGQLIRLVETIAIISGTGPQTNPGLLVLPKFDSQAQPMDGKRVEKGKATMLFVQAIKMTLEIGGEAVFQYGDINNSDARPFDQMKWLFACLKDVFGICFTLVRGGDEIYTLHRGENVGRMDRIEIEVDNHMADEIIFTAIILSQKGEDVPHITIKTPTSRDYHIGAMVRAGSVLNMNISDTRDDLVRTIVISS